MLAVRGADDDQRVRKLEEQDFTAKASQVCKELMHKQQLQLMRLKPDQSPVVMDSSKPEAHPVRSDGVATCVTDAPVKIPGSEKGIENNLQEAVVTNGRLGTSHPVAMKSTSFGSISSSVPNSSSNHGPPAESPFIFSSTSSPISVGLSNSFLNGTSNLASSTSTTSSAAVTLISAASSTISLSSTEAASFPNMPIFYSGSSSNPLILAFSSDNAETSVTKIGKETNTANTSNLLFSPTSLATLGTGNSIFGLSSKIASSTAVSQPQDSLSSSGDVSTPSAQSSLAASGTASVIESKPVQLGSSASSPIFGTSGIASFTSSNTLFSSSTAAVKPFGTGIDLGSSSSTSLAKVKSFGTGTC